MPMILFVRPQVIRLNETECAIKIPLRRRTQNHLKCLYIGGLAIGADLAAGVIAMQMISLSKLNIHLLFKDMQADFLKRVDGDALFTCTEGKNIETLIQKVIDSGERQNQSIKVQVTSPDKYGDEILANFTMTLTLKRKD